MPPPESTRPDSIRSEPGLAQSLRRGIAGAITVALAAIVVWGLFTGDAREVDRVEALGARIKCPVCQGESIVESPSPYAADILSFVEERVAEGWTDDEIVAYLEERFAGINLDPGFSGVSLVLWLLPVAAIGGGVAVAFRRTRPSHEDEPDE